MRRCVSTLNNHDTGAMPIIRNEKCLHGNLFAQPIKPGAHESYRHQEVDSSTSFCLLPWTHTTPFVSEVLLSNKPRDRLLSLQVLDGCHAVVNVMSYNELFLLVDQGFKLSLTQGVRAR